MLMLMDCLVSRLPLAIMPEDRSSSEASLFNLSQIDTLPVTFADIQDATQKDVILSKHACGKWLSKVPKNFLSYYCLRFDLTLEGKCLPLGSCVIIPDTLQGAILHRLHETHPGMTYEESGKKKLYLEIRIRPANWRPCQSMCTLPAKLWCTCTSPIESMDLAHKTLAKDSCWFCWPLYGKIIFYRGGRTLQVARSVWDDTDHHHEHNNCSASPVRKVRITSPVGLRQWSSVHIWGVPTI